MPAIPLLAKASFTALSSIALCIAGLKLHSVFLLMPLIERLSGKSTTMIGEGLAIYLIRYCTTL